MKPIIVSVALLSAPLSGCVSPACTTIVNGQSSGYDGMNYDAALILAVDGHRLPEPTLHVGVPAGIHHLLVQVSTGRGGSTDISEVEFDATFAVNRAYFVNGWYGGVRVYEDDAKHMDGPNDYTHLVDLMNAKVLPR